MIAAASGARRLDLDDLADGSPIIIGENDIDPGVDECIWIAKDDKWNSRIDAMVHCILKFPKLPCALIYTTWHAALCSLLMLLESRKGVKFKYGSDWFRRYGEFTDLRLALEYSLLQYLSEASEHVTSNNSKIWHLLLRDAFALSWPCVFSDHSGSSRFVSSRIHYLDSYNSQARPAPHHLQLVELESLLNLILVSCGGTPSKFLVLCYRSLAASGFISTSAGYFSCKSWFKWLVRIAAETLVSPSFLLIANNSEVNHCGHDCARKECLFATWARYDCTFFFARARSPLLCLLHQIRQAFAKIIHEKSDHNAVNNVCKTYGTALHAVIESNGTRESFAITLIALARLGADPNVQRNGLTPLQLCEAKQPGHYFDNRFSVVTEVLQYHKFNSSWPEFGPIIKKYPLQGPALWRFDTQGKIILDPIDNSETVTDRLALSGFF